jgi:hypothetical protein
MKPWYPGEVECDAATSALVTSRWSEYFSGGVLGQAIKNG